MKELIIHNQETKSPILVIKDWNDTAAIPLNLVRGFDAQMQQRDEYGNHKIYDILLFSEIFQYPFWLRDVPEHTYTTIRDLLLKQLKNGK